MVLGLFRRNRTKETSRRLAADYGAALEARCTYIAPITALPASKDDIKAALLDILGDRGEVERHDAVRAAYSYLAHFQPMSAKEQAELHLYQMAVSAATAENSDEKLHGAVTVLTELAPTRLRFDELVAAEAATLERELANITYESGNR